MIGRRVKSAWFGLTDGEIVEWQPLGHAMCDVRVRDAATSRDCWYGSHSLTPIDGKGPLPSRREAQAKATAEQIASLEAIRAQHIATFHTERWPGAEHGKAIIGRAIDSAIESLKREER